MWSTLLCLMGIAVIILVGLTTLAYANIVYFNPEILKPFVSDTRWVTILKDVEDPHTVGAVIVLNLLFGSLIIASNLGKPIRKLFTIIGSIPDLIFSKYCKQISKDK